MKLTDDAWTHKGVKDISRDRASGLLQIHGFDWVTNKFCTPQKIAREGEKFFGTKVVESVEHHPSG